MRFSKFMGSAGTSQSLARAGAVLTAVVAIAAGLAAWRASGEGVAGEALAVAVAAAVCWATSLAALLLAGAFCQTPNAISAILGGTLIRTFVPLAVAVVVQSQQGVLAKAGLPAYVLGFFLLTLVVETLLVVPVVLGARKQVADHVA